MARIHVERRDLPEDVRHVLDLLNDGGTASTAAECTPPADVLETPAGLEVILDIPGVRTSAVEVFFARNVLVIAGEKLPPPHDHSGATYHLAERGFGRFVRTLRLDGAFDAGRATASLAGGELRVVLPRIEERRGREIRIPVSD